MNIKHPIVDRRYKKLDKKIGDIKDLALKTTFGDEFENEKDTLLFASNVEIIQNAVRKTYLPMITEKYTPIEPDGNFSVLHRVRVFQIKKWVTDRTENLLDKLSNVYSALSGLDCSVALVFRRTKTEAKVYFVITNQSENMIDPAVVDSYFGMFVAALCGNFPGSEIEEIETFCANKENAGLMDEWFSEKNSGSVAMITDIASESSEKFVSQGIEKLLDGIVPQSEEDEYTLILLAEPIGSEELDQSKQQYSEAYTQLSPFAEVQTTISVSDAYSRTKTISESISKGHSSGINFIVGLNKNKSIQDSYGFSDSSITTKGSTVSSTRTNYRVKEALEIIETHIKRIQQGEARGMWNFAAYVLSDTFATAQSVANMYRSLTEGEESFQETQAINIWNANRSESKHAIERIRESLRRFRHPEFLLRGLEEIVDKPDSQALTVEQANLDVLTLPAQINGVASVTGRELAMSLNFPQKSVAGFPVIECAEFGRNIVSYGQDNQTGEIEVGRIFHMNHEENSKVALFKKSLCSHVFITGSTGSGKSNTVYQILNEVIDTGAKFLVIEPAKGEYKNIFGNDKDVSVYGTNPYLSQLLRLNPFSFPDGIHVFEHLDRLVEIFNVCWPMFAAMPAVLKNAIEKSYVDCGWDLMRSVNKYGEKIYPTFADVAENIRIIIDTSDYDSDNKGAYKGSLLTRLQSLTNGIYGTIFVSDEIPGSELFDENVIIDLSRVGSAETKSLIMGMLILKLQEYRITSGSAMNSDLRHVTILEEAHNILRRTSFEQNAETANLAGKSVEMIANAIAEMRTYGEGFVIVDQSPGLLDMSSIRNTNTKIILRLPDQSDRELVGRAANLTDDQITELAKLPCGVAAIYQNEWIQPILCKINEFKAPKSSFTYEPDEDVFSDRNTRIVSDSLLHCIMDKEIFRNGNKIDLLELKHKIVISKLDSSVKTDFMEYLAANPNDEVVSLRKLVYDFLDAKKAIENSQNCSDLSNWVSSVLDGLQPSIKGYSRKQINIALALLIYEQTMRDSSYNDLFCRFTEVYQTEGGVY